MLEGIGQHVEDAGPRETRSHLEPSGDGGTAWAEALGCLRAGGRGPAHSWRNRGGTSCSHSRRRKETVGFAQRRGTESRRINTGLGLSAKTDPRNGESASGWTEDSSADVRRGSGDVPARPAGTGRVLACAMNNCTPTVGTRGETASPRNKTYQDEITKTQAT